TADGVHHGLGLQPQQIVRWPRASHRGATRERASFGPEAKIVNCPALWGPCCPTPERRGASHQDPRHPPWRDPLDSRHADRAHLHPDRARSQSSERAPVAAIDMTASMSVTIVTT